MALRDLLNSISSSIKKKTQDDTGFIQKGKFTLQPIKQVASNVVNYNPTGKKSLGQATKQVISELTPKTALPYARIAENKSNNAFLRSGADIVNQGLKSFTNMATLGLVQPRMGERQTKAGVAGNIGGGIAGFTINPLGKTMGLTDKLVSRVAPKSVGIIPKIAKGLGSEALQTLGYSGASLAGSKLGLNEQTNQLAPKNLATNFALGSLLRGSMSPQIQNKVLGIFKTPKTIDEKTAAEIGRLVDKSKLGFKIKGQIDNQALKDIDVLTNRFIGKVPKNMTYTDKVKLLEQTTNYQNIPNLGRMGIVSQPTNKKINIKNEPVLKIGTTKKGKVSTKYMNLTDQEKLQVDELNQELSKIYKPTVISNKDVLQKSLLTKGRSIPRSDEQQKTDLAKALNTRQEFVKYTKEFDNLKNQGAPESELLKIREKQINQSRVVSQERSYAGRRLQIEKVMSDFASTPEQRIFAMLDAAGVDKNKFIKDSLNVDFNNVKQVVEFYRKYVPPKFIDILDEIKYTNMLSSPVTHLVNITSNLGASAVVEPVKKTITGQIDWIKSGLTGSERKYYASQGLDYAKGYWKALPDAWTKFKNILSGQEISVKPDLLTSDAQYMPTTTSGLLNIYTTPLRAMEGADQFFKTLIRSGEITALSDPRLKLSTQEITKKAEQNANYLLFRQAIDPKGELGQGYVLRAFDHFTSLIQNLRRIPVAGKWIIPFLQTPMNILKQGYEYSPVGVTTLIGAKNKTEQLAKAMIGTTVFGSILELVDSGNITWSAPGNKKDKELFYAAGMQPYSIKIGDKWYSYSKLGQLAYPVAMAAAIKWADKNNPDQNAIQNVGSAVPQMMLFFGDQSYVSELGNLLDALRTGEGNIFSNAMSSQTSNMVSQLVPYRSFMGWLTRIVDPTYRKSDSIMQSIGSQIPGLSTNTPAYQDIYGQESKRDLPITNALSPIKISIEKPSAANLYKTQEQYRIDQNQIKKMQQEYEKSAGSKTPTTTTTKGVPQFYVKEDGSVGKLDISKITSLPESSNYEKAIKIDKIMGTVKTIMNSVPAGDDRTKILNSLGVDEGIAQYYQIADQNQDIRTAMVIDKLQTSQNNNETAKILIDGLYEINGKSIVTTSLLNDLVKQGIITKGLKDYVLSTYSKMTGKKTGTGGGTTGYYESKFKKRKEDTLKKVTTPRVKITIPKLPKINLKND